MADVSLFIFSGAQSYNLAVPSRLRTKPIDPKATKAQVAARDAEIDLYNRVGQDFIRFTHQAGSGAENPKAVYLTTDAVVAKFLRKTSKQHNLPIREDLTLMKVRCPYCEFVTDGNTLHDQRALAEHIATVHDTDTESGED